MRLNLSCSVPRSLPYYPTSRDSAHPESVFNECMYLLANAQFLLEFLGIASRAFMVISSAAAHSHHDASVVLRLTAKPDDDDVHLPILSSPQPVNPDYLTEFPHCLLEGSGGLSIYSASGENPPTVIRIEYASMQNLTMRLAGSACFDWHPNQEILRYKYMCGIATQPLRLYLPRDHPSLRRSGQSSSLTGSDGTSERGRASSKAGEDQVRSSTKRAFRNRFPRSRILVARPFYNI